MTEPAYLAGRLLLAMPGMGDPRFDHAVIALMLHDGNGALGIAVGEPHADLRLHTVLDDLGIDPGVAPDCPVLVGGPVEPQRGFVLHSPDWQGEGTLVAGDLACMTGSQAILRAIAAGTGPVHWLFALGYAGWDAGQLDAEMRGHGWYAAAGHAGVLFDTPAPARWQAAWRAEGVDPALLASATGRA